MCIRDRWKTVPSSGKVIASVVFIYHLEMANPLAEYCAVLLEQLNKTIKVKRSYLAKQVHFHQDSTPAQTSSIAVAKLHELR